MKRNTTKTISLPPEMWAELDATPNRSAAIRNALEWSRSLALDAERVGLIHGLLGAVKSATEISAPPSFVASSVQDACDDAYAAVIHLRSAGLGDTEMLAMVDALIGSGVPIGPFVPWRFAGTATALDALISQSVARRPARGGPGLDSIRERVTASPDAAAAALALYLFTSRAGRDALARVIADQ